jgi:DNA repair protein RadA/Sms
MAAQKSYFVCQNCGYKTSKWIGKCPSCNSWNTFSEEIEFKSSSSQKAKSSFEKDSPISITKITQSKQSRIKTEFSEFDRVLGGGIVQGSVILFGGEPGVGKSTLLLQIALKLHSSILYITGEESKEQIKLRADRISSQQNENCIISTENCLERIIELVKETKPEFVIIDSVQTIYSEKLDSLPSSITQIRECTYELSNIARFLNIPVILVGHINKEGSLAGPKVLEHIVDVVLQFEGDKNFVYRILRAQKNRYGSISEIGVFEMKDKGLIEIKDTSQLLVNKNIEKQSGNTYGISIEGYRPFIIEVQALVSSAVYGNPQRVSNGYDYKRLNMLLAVLEKRAKFKLTIKDVFINMAGGFKINDPGIDLPTIVSILSSDLNLSVPEEICFCGEVGLSGEIRPISRIEERIKEAQKIGFKKIVISQFHAIDLKKVDKIEIVRVKNVSELAKTIFA